MCPFRALNSRARCRTDVRFLFMISHFYSHQRSRGLLAQSAERRANNANVMSSILIQAKCFLFFFFTVSFFYSVQCNFFFDSNKTESTTHYISIIQRRGGGLEANFPKQMLHSPSEWSRKTFAGGMPKIFCHLWCSQCGDPSPSKMT